MREDRYEYEYEDQGEVWATGDDWFDAFLRVLFQCLGVDLEEEDKKLAICEVLRLLGLVDSRWSNDMEYNVWKSTERLITLANKSERFSREKEALMKEKKQRGISAPK